MKSPELGLFFLRASTRFHPATIYAFGSVPREFKPMPVLPKEPFSHPDWLFELKWDGFRALAFIERGECRLISKTETPSNRMRA